MSILEKIDWSLLLHIAPDDLKGCIFQFTAEEKVDNSIFRYYTLFSENESLDYSRLFRYLKSIVHQWVLDPMEIEELELEGVDAVLDALSVFGTVDPLSDGKLGELILFAMIESELKAPLVYHKMSGILPNDQAKGTDAFHIGKRNGSTILLFGESKIRGDFTQCIEDALGSIEGFHQEGRSKLKDEVKIARRGFHRALPNLSSNDLSELYKTFDPRKNGGTIASAKLFHPTLLVYDQNGFDSWLKTDGFPAKQAQIIQGKATKKTPLVAARVKKKAIDATFEFFMIPLDNTSNFRNEFFTFLHGKKFIPKKERVS